MNRNPQNVKENRNESKPRDNGSAQTQNKSTASTSQNSEKEERKDYKIAEIAEQLKAETKECDSSSEKSVHHQAKGDLFQTLSPRNTAKDVESIEKALRSEQDKLINKIEFPYNSALTSDISDRSLVDERVHQFSQISQGQFVPCLAAPDVQPSSSRIDDKRTEVRVKLPPWASEEFSTEDLDTICRICNRSIIFSSELIVSLVKEMKRLSKCLIDSEKTITTLMCRICNRHLQDGFLKHHLKAHGFAKELYYCLKCQRQINDITIEPLPDSDCKEKVITRDGTFFPLLETKKVELNGVSTPDPLIEPRCGKCGRIFDYIGPLLHKILDSSLKIYRSEKNSVSIESCYLCRLCQKGESSLHSMQCHALEHVQYGEVICKVCKGELPDKK